MRTRLSKTFRIKLFKLLIKYRYLRYEDWDFIYDYNWRSSRMRAKRIIEIRTLRHFRNSTEAEIKKLKIIWSTKCPLKIFKREELNKIVNKNFEDNLIRSMML